MDGLVEFNIVVLNQLFSHFDQISPIFHEIHDNTVHLLLDLIELFLVGSYLGNGVTVDLSVFLLVFNHENLLTLGK